jgi:uncharacterized membrane protein YbhN (UPF0104 family)
MIAGLALGAVFLWLALRDDRATEAVAALRQAQPGWLLITFLCGVGFTMTKALRWAPLVNQVASVPPGLVLRAIWAGTAVNLVVAHTGELLRATLIARRTGAAAAAVLATIAVERVFDFGALAVLCAAGVLLDGRLAESLGVAGAIAAAVVAIGLLAARLLGARMPDGEQPPDGRPGATPEGLAPGGWLAALGRAARRARAWLANQRQRARAGLTGLSDPALARRVAVLSLVQWVWVVAAIWASAAAVDAAPSLAGSLAVFALMLLGLTLPAAPAHLGTTQLAYVAGFAMVGQSGAPALAASLVYTGCVILPQLVAGGVLALSPGTRMGLTRPSVSDP